MIKYVTGDATAPIGEGKKFIIHCCNDIGGWGSGFVLAISKKWKKPEQAYRGWANSGNESFKLGNIQVVPVSEDISIVNMIGQRDVRWDGDIPPVRYEAIREALKAVSVKAKEANATIHAPKFGSDLAGGKWEEIEKIINEELSDVSVTVYNFSAK